MKRLLIIKEKVAFLNAVKDRGLDLQRVYELDDLVYDPQTNKFGRVSQCSHYYFTVTYIDKSITYFRRTGWKPCKDQFLVDQFRVMTNKELASTLNCSEKVIEKKLNKLSLKRNFAWDEEKDRFLIENYAQSNQWLAAQLMTTVSSIKGRLFRLKTRGLIPEEQPRNSHSWNESDDSLLLENLQLSNQKLAERFGVTVSTIKNRLRKLRGAGRLKPARSQAIVKIPDAD